MSKKLPRSIPKLRELQRPVNVHLHPDGSKAIAEQVPGAIEKALRRGIMVTWGWGHQAS